MEYLYKLDMYTGRAEEIDLAEPPVAIGSMPAGAGARADEDLFYITHDIGLGLISFLDPKTNNVHEVAGFASLGIADPIELQKNKGGK